MIISLLYALLIFRYPQSKDPRQDKPEARTNNDNEDDNWDYDVELPYH